MKKPDEKKILSALAQIGDRPFTSNDVANIGKISSKTVAHLMWQFPLYQAIEPYDPNRKNRVVWQKISTET